MSGLSKLPILLSVPHGGTWIPPEVKNYCLLSLEDMLVDGDTWSKELFALGNQIETVLSARVARAVVDLNRDAAERPPENPDGVIKSVTVFGKPVWNFNQGLLPPELARYLLQAYYYPYHKQLIKLIAIRKPKLAIDCHTMLDKGPMGSKDAGEKRPDICISNRGNKTAAPELMQKIAEVLKIAFDGAEVAINKPFLGGHIITFHGQNALVPWIQLEFNRSMYVPKDIPLRLKPDVVSRLQIEEMQKKLTWALTQVIFSI